MHDGSIVPFDRFCKKSLTEREAVSKSRRFVAVSAAAVVVAVLPACDPGQVGTAAAVGGAQLSVSDLQDHITEVVELRNDAIEEYELQIPELDPGRDVADVQNEVLNRWVVGKVYQDLADDLDITVSEADIDEFLDQFAGQFPDGDMTPFMAEQSFTEESLRDEVRTALISERLVEAAGDEQAAQQAVQSAVAESDVEINPRYGTWTEQGLVAESGSVSVPAEGEATGDGELPGQ